MDGAASTLGVGAATVVPTQPRPGPAAAVEAEWAAGAGETSAPPLQEATTTSPRVRAVAPAAGTAKIEPSITRPGPGTGARLAARVRSTRKSPRDDAREARRPAARVAQATSAIRTRKRTRKPTPRTARNTATPAAEGKSPSRRAEAPRLACSRPGVCPLDGGGAEAAVEETSSGAAAILEAHQEGTGSGPTRALTPGRPNRRCRAESSKVHRRAPATRSLAEEGTEARRKTRRPTRVRLPVRASAPFSRLRPLRPPPPPRTPPRTESHPSKVQPTRL